MTKEKKPKILCIVPFYLPGFRGGGPIRTIENMVNLLSDDFNFLIITSDRDLGDSCAYKNITLNSWNTIGKAQVYYVDSNKLTQNKLANIINQANHDILYLNSFFSSKFTIKPLILRRLKKIPDRPTIIAPRGEFSEGAIKVKYWKKFLFIKISTLLSLYKGVKWQASSKYELHDISKEISHLNATHDVIVAPNLIINKLPKTPLIKEEKKPYLKICFLSRISPKKNIDFALSVLSKTKTQIIFDIYGPIEDHNYWSSCQNLIDKLPSHVKANYKGSIAHDEVISTLKDYDLFFVPTHGENFGHVFVEAWSSGIPILVSDKTPWRDLKNSGLGWDIPLNEYDKFIQTIDDFYNLDKDSLLLIKEQCLKFATKIMFNNETIKMNRDLFLSNL